MASYNRIIMMGNLTRDPEYKQVGSGQGVCRFGLASNRQFKNKQTGTMVQEVCFVDIDVWGAQAESCNQYLQKGRAVLVEGRLKLDSWQDQDGNKRSKHSIVADRVTFLAAASPQAEEGDYDAEGMGAVATNVSTSKVSFDEQFEPAKEVAPKRAAKPKATLDAQPTNSGEIAFSDEKPFEDDLPF
ncbi:single-stranded DNA-binding protein [Candidatus Babeliales bacterium]|nr:single-stranded DNA-binding protein [Candidatus Babeliales bacterium]MBY0353774.1 single-stranded DNA-binding protein [Candidatus Babeliales bacterium]